MVDSVKNHKSPFTNTSGWCLTPTLLLICSSFSRENGHIFLICSSLSTAQTSNRITSGHTFTSTARIGQFRSNHHGTCIENWFAATWASLPNTSHRPKEATFSLDLQLFDAEGKGDPPKWWFYKVAIYHFFQAIKKSHLII